MDQRKPKVLGIDDDASWLDQLALILEDQCSVVGADTIEKGLKLIENTFFDIIVLDLNFEGDERTGLDVFRIISAVDQGADILVISGETDHRKLIKIFNSGVKRFISKPATPDEIRGEVAGILAERENKRRALNHIAQSKGADPFIGSSPLIYRLREDINRIIESGAKDVLILGESGTGKELIAQSIANSSERFGRMVAVHCGAITDSLSESELFGHVKGAFTGANTAREGVFEAAKGGYVFLDEIGEMPLSQQAKLLRVIQERKVRPVGSNTEKKISFRSISATNRNILGDVQEGRFREDLYYRIAKEQIIIPSLRERREDIPELVNYFIQKEAKGKCVEVSVDAMMMLQAYSWRGNVRELISVVYKLVNRIGEGVIKEKHICQALPQIVGDFTRKPIRTKMKLYSSQISKERRRYEDAIASAHGNRTKAAEILGISRATFFRKAKELGLVNERPRKSNDVEARV